ncbi:hypothetical protein NDU88_003199 [Pleurodeles waltl]|uniref:Uncharacterized protein n=1 Tax=Pleurodeles waltl TaxID=8319 RepID=A0AAV7NJ78_PLEWA|nr:hypothetical protein NDU88_003199 [Pleurodeles waltl]
MPDPSVKAACVDVATGNPELEDGVACHLGFPRVKGAGQPTRVPENAVKEGRRAAEGKKSVEEAGVWRAVNGWPKWAPVRSIGTGKGEDQTESALDGSGTLTAAQEAYHEDSSHASGEAWHSQVRS